MRTALVLLFASVSLLHAQRGLRSPSFLGNLSGTPLNIILTESFEGTGYENPWTVDAGTVDPDDTSFAIGGTQNLSVQRIGVTSRVGTYWPIQAGITNRSVVGFKFAFKAVVTNVNYTVCEVSSNGTVNVLVQMRTTGRIRIYDAGGTINASPTEGVPAGTTVYLFCASYLNAGTGGIEFSTTSTRSGTASRIANFSGGATGRLVNRFQFAADAATVTNYVDLLTIADGALP